MTNAKSLIVPVAQNIMPISYSDDNEQYKPFRDKPYIAELFAAYRDEITGATDYAAIVELAPSGMITAEQLEDFTAGNTAFDDKGSYSAVAKATHYLVNAYRRDWGKAPVKISELFPHYRV